MNNNSKIKKTFIVTLDENYRRIDNWFFSYFKELPKSMVYKSIRKGKIRVNSKLIEPKYKLKVNDKIDIYIETNINNKKNINLNNNNIINILSNKILYEDNYLLVINKPYGLYVHSNTKNDTNDIISNLKFIRPNAIKLNLVHRLDKETSGILIISKDYITLRKLHDQFRENKVNRKYIALVYGHWNSNIKLVNLPINKCFINKKSFSIINSNGKKSLTLFKIKEFINKFTLMDINLITGRYHQIRVHASHYGNPIVLDKIYGNKSINSNIIKLGLKRLFLHANNIKFLHPILNKYISIESNIDFDLFKFLVFLRKKDISII